MKNDTDSGGPEPVAQAQPATSESAARTSRRRFGKAGLAAPVIMTLASRPVWGTTGACSLSGDMFSGNVSNRHDDYECTAGYGCTPGFWKNNTAAWDPTGFDPGQCKQRNDDGTCEIWDAFENGTQFSVVFKSVPGCAPDHATLMEVLQTCNGHLAWHATGALLNAAHPSIDYGATVAQVIDAWNRAQEGGDLDAVQLHTVFDNMNNRGCPLNAHGDCDDGFTTEGDDPTCIPVRTSGSS